MSHINVEKKSIFDKKLNNVNSCILKIENLTLAYGNKKVLDDIILSVKRGEIVTILGPNGGGKTSLVKAVVGINKGFIGSIIFADNVKISYMPQNFSIGNLMPITVAILDEPVSAMDINARAKFYDIINKIAKERLVSILMTSHDLNSVIPYSDYIICINNTIYYQGKSGEIMELNKVFNSYVAK